MKLNVVLFQEGPYWVAQGLEHDITAQGKKIPDALYELQRLLVGYIALRQQKNLPPLELDLPKAPEIYWRRYEEASSRLEPRERISLSSQVPVDVQSEYRVAA